MLHVPDATITVPLHESSGTHHAYIFVGSPPQRQSLIVDTGSRLMAFPCKPCRSCGEHESIMFDPGISTTDIFPNCGECFLEGVSSCGLKDNLCHFKQRYTEGSSFEAVETSDLIWFGSNDEDESAETFMRLAVPFTFGCLTTETGLFKTQDADGIMGLALHDKSIIQTLYDEGSIKRKAFSLCLSNDGGNISLGGSFTSQHSQPMQFARMTKSGNWFSVTVLDISLSCQTCDSAESSTWLSGLIPDETPEQMFSSGKGTIIDSGTTDTYLPAPIEDAFKRVWFQITNMNFDERARLYTHEEFLRLPSITFSFESASDNGEGDNPTRFYHTINPMNYMDDVPMDNTGKQIKPWVGKRELTCRVYLDEPYGAVLGAAAMIGYDILFDIDNERVGIAPSDCDQSNVI